MRLHLPLALITILVLVLTLRASKGHHFGFAQVQEFAERQAGSPYVPLPDVLPPQLKTLTPEQEKGIFWKDAYRLWRKKGLPFQVDFYPQLKSNPLPHVAPEINTVDRRGPHPLAYAPAFFNFLNLTFNPPLPPDLGYAGFYLRYPDMGPGSHASSLDGFFSALGGSYFRVLAKDQVYGLSARGLGVNTVDEHKEEFPQFTRWWLQEPAPNATQLVLDALLDGPSVTGAYEFKIRPGAQTSVDIHATLFFRQPVSQLEIAPFSSMYLYGENAKNHFGNFHPEVHDSDGVLMNTGHGEWIWRPLEQATQRQVYNFSDENPKGFGLIQRDRDFKHYQDLDFKYNVRPSAWVTPHGNWGKGVVELIQLITNNTDTDNVVLFWHPEQPARAGDRIDLDYTIDFYMNDANRPPLAYCYETLINDPAPPPPSLPAAVSKPGTLPATPPIPVATAPNTAKPATTPVQFLIDFMGDGIEDVPGNQPPDLNLVANPPETVIREKMVEKNTFDNSWRVVFTIIPFKKNVPTELKCGLVHNSKPMTETWTYTWHQ